MTDLPRIQVTQEDREAAADRVKANPNWRGLILEGKYDDGEEVQAFTRHRIATEQRIRDESAARIAELEAALTKASYRAPPPRPWR